MQRLALAKSNMRTTGGRHEEASFSQRFANASTCLESIDCGERNLSYSE